MDSIERMRRLNELTKELKQHGFAESSFEAIQQANQIYGDDDITSEVKNGIIRNSATDRAQTSGEGNMDDGALINMDKKINKLNDSVNTLTEKLNEIIKAINDIDIRINTLKNRPAERVVEKIIERPERTERQTQVQEPVARNEQQASVHNEEQHEQAKKDEYSTNQRTGNFQSQDVAIDKMFYYGKK